MASVAITASANALMLSFDDDADHQGGTITYDGLGGPAIGTDISFTSVVGVDTDLNDGVALNTVAAFNFVTGDNVLEIAPNLYVFDGGGSFTIEGDVTQGTNLIADGVLVSGTFDTATVSGNGQFLTFSGFGIDTKNQDLLDFYDIDALNFDFVNTEIAMDAVFDSNGGFVAQVTNADFDNTPSVSDESSTIALLGLGLAGLGAIARRRK